jgi:hypothetical protein
LLVKNSFILPFVLAGSVCISAATSGETVTAEGRSLIDRNTTRDQACQKALLESKMNALSNLGLETIGFIQEEVCSEVDDDTNCVLYQDTVNSTTGGYISHYDRSEEIDNDDYGDWCVIRIQAEVEKYKEDLDPDYIMSATLNQRVFLEGTSIKIKGEINKESYIYVLGWYPDIDPDSYRKLYPNHYEKDELTIGKFSIPSQEKGEQYELPTEFSDDLKNDRTNEWLILLASKQKIEVPSREKTTDFYSRLNILGQNKWIIRRLGYSIVKRDNL